MRQAHIGVFVHLIWSTWDRLPFLTIQTRPQVWRAIGAKCVELGAEVIAIGGIEDHVHLLVRLPATLAVADLVKHVKGASSHLVNFQLPDGGTFRWQGAYAAFSVGPRDLRQVIDYIARQAEHHATETLIAEWELASATTVNTLEAKT
ncbi:MAG: IS200/IS605 family transposase [Thermomicrobiales bacterium]